MAEKSLCPTGREREKERKRENATKDRNWVGAEEEKFNA